MLIWPHWGCEEIQKGTAAATYAGDIMVRAITHGTGDYSLEGFVRTYCVLFKLVVSGREEGSINGKLVQFQRMH